MSIHIWHKAGWSGFVVCRFYFLRKPVGQLAERCVSFVCFLTLVIEYTIFPFLWWPNYEKFFTILRHICFGIMNNKIRLFSSVKKTVGLTRKTAAQLAAVFLYGICQFTSGACGMERIVCLPLLLFCESGPDSWPSEPCFALLFCSGISIHLFSRKQVTEKRKNVEVSAKILLQERKQLQWAE